MKKTSWIFVVIFCSLSSIANVTLPRIFGNNMVLQRNKPIAIWGWADAGEKISVQFNKQVKKTKAGKDGFWKIELNKELAGGPYQLVVTGKNTITLENVLVGEVCF